MSPSSPAVPDRDPARSTDQAVDADHNLGLWPLVGLIIGSMIGAGIFHLPAQMAGTAAPGPNLIGWGIFGTGMLVLALVFQNLGRRAPTVDGGVYGFAKDGFGDYVGFTSAWGYWFSTWTGSVGYLVLLFSTLGRYLSPFKDGQTWQAILGASVVLWLVHGLILAGIRQATFINAVVSACKVIPLVVFLVLGVIAWRRDVFTADVWGHGVQVEGAGLGSVGAQVNGMMLLAVWYFLGIEGASVYAARARDRADAARATMIGFLTVLTLLVGVNVLSYGIVRQAELAGYPEPSLAGVLRDAVGPWGEHFITVAIVISLVGAYMSWMLLSSEILMYPAHDGVLPRVFGKENSHGVPVTGLWLTSLCMQAMLLMGNTYTKLTLLAGAMVLLPYFWTAAYQVLIAVRDHRGDSAGTRAREILLGVLAVLFAVYLIYFAAGLPYLLVACIAFFLGTILYVWARRERGLALFSRAEWVVFAVVTVAAVVGAWQLAHGQIAVS
ncbi:basic amino acid/polyamine antiporter [Arsenicicoccus dermatophilus]|uniref:basic amino acid/polyamine antiporter n=1 Tax=Arsenicicoccus dermatophilus TaxID=1076331 RepID=UPI0039173516